MQFIKDYYFKNIFRAFKAMRGAHSLIVVDLRFVVVGLNVVLVVVGENAAGAGKAQRSPYTISSRY